ncbi:MAG: hypothetical protein V1652_04165 [bacterium]
MQIDLTKEQYECLVKALETGSSVYGVLGDCVSDDYKKESDEMEQLQKYFLSFASDFSMGYITEQFDEELIMSDEYSEQLQEAMNDYDDATFWHELMVRLGQRDLERTATEEEKQEMTKNDDLYLDRLNDVYQKLEEEFEDHGIERLEIAEGDGESQ